MKGSHSSALIRAVALCALAGTTLAGPATLARQAQPADTRAAGAIDLGDQRFIELTVGQSRLIRTPWLVRRVQISDPSVADVEVLSPEQVLVIGKRVGSTDLNIWDPDEQVRHIGLDVQADLGGLQRQIDRLFPDADVRLEMVQSVVVARGTFRRTEDVAALRELLTRTNIPFVDMTTVAGVQQVRIKIRIAEVSRNAIRQLGTNFVYSGDDFSLVNALSASGGSSLIETSIGQGTHTATASDAVTLFGRFWNEDFSFFLQALAENQYLRILAEPALTCLSGEEATFLAGGEFPIPIVQGGSSDSTSVTIEYREFGARLAFTPTVLGDGKMRVRVASEVSELSDIGSVVLQGFRVPSIQTRRAATTLEMSSGQSFVIAGLLQQRSDARNSRIPLLGDLPVLGSLFRSVRYARGETELLIFCTASLVEPLDMVDDPPLPGSAHVTPNDWELYVAGKIQGKPSPLAAPDAAWLRARGMTRLRGPGAWTFYGQEPATSMVIDRRQRSVRPTEPPAGETDGGAGGAE